jgi:Flp pilus assembly protein TadG
MPAEINISVRAMSDTSMTGHINRAARRFGGANHGNVAVIFGIALVPLISFIGAAIDYSRVNKARSSMQAALDSTALMLSKDLSEGLITSSQVNAKAQTYFAALYTNKEAESVSVTATYTASTSMGSTIELQGSGSVVTDFMKVAGFPNLNFNTNSTSAWGNVRMRVAMALDNTGSMASDGKMPAMQTAAKNLIDQLSGLAKTSGDIYVSIVPFAKDVNFGKDALGNSNVNQDWIDWSLWDVANGSWGSCSSSSYTTKSTCESHSKVWTPDHTKWTGCFTDRAQDYDTKNTTPVASNSPTLFPAEEYVSGSEKYCKSSNNPYLQPIMPLSYDWSSLKNLIGNMQPTGNTNQGIGMAWAWMTLGQGTPFNAPAKDPNYTYKDAIILLSDGLNTQNRYSNSASQIDARQKILCDNAKAAGITIYTIHVNTGSPPDPTSAVLQYCASSPENFFLVTAASQTVAAFKSIGASLSKLRVAR